MQGIKNLIARRRPVSEPVPNTATPVPRADAPRDPWQALQDQLSSDSAPRDYDIENARAGRNHVPRPERPRPMSRQEWVPQSATAVDTVAPQERAGDAPKIWDLDPPLAPAVPAPAEPETAGSALARSAAGMALPAAHEHRSVSERVKTRLLGFHAEAAGPDPFSTPPASPAASDPRFPIGWIVVIEGPGRGASFTLTAGLSTVGRDPDQTVTLDFGDTSISRERHLAIAHDDEENRTYIGHGGKTNIVRHNDKPLLTTEELCDGDTVRIGKTVLRFVGFCGGGFCWTDAATPGTTDG